jgi:hypothetical protein
MNHFDPEKLFLNTVEDQRGVGTIPEWAAPFSKMGAVLPPSTKLMIPQGE